MVTDFHHSCEDSFVFYQEVFELLQMYFITTD